jgi:hypothetical protein
VGTDRIICYDGIAHEIWKSPTSVERKTLLKLGRQATHEATFLLGVNVHLL